MESSDPWPKLGVALVVRDESFKAKALVGRETVLLENTLEEVFLAITFLPRTEVTLFLWVGTRSDAGVDPPGALELNRPLGTKFWFGLGLKEGTPWALLPVLLGALHRA